MQPALPVPSLISPAARMRVLFRVVGWSRLALVALGLGAIGLALYVALVAYPVTLRSQVAPGDVVYGGAFVAGQAGVTLETAAGAADAGATGTIAEKFYDFGRIDAGQVVEHTFVIANTGSRPLLIRRAATTCGCTTAQFSAAEIPAGKVALVTLRFDPAYHDMRGSTVRRGLTIVTNDAAQPVQEIWVQATVQ